MKTFFLAFIALDAASTWKGRSVPEGPPPGMGKMMCNNFIYTILAGEDSKNYPLANGLEPAEKGSYSSSGGACSITEDGSTVTISNCDCSDPKSYNFADKELCKIYEAGPPKDGKNAMTDKQKALACGAGTYFLSVGLMILCTLLKM